MPIRSATSIGVEIAPADRIMQRRVSVDAPLLNVGVRGQQHPENLPDIGATAIGPRVLGKPAGSPISVLTAARSPRS